MPQQKPKWTNDRCAAGYANDVVRYRLPAPPTRTDIRFINLCDVYDAGCVEQQLWEMERMDASELAKLITEMKLRVQNGEKAPHYLDTLRAVVSALLHNRACEVVALTSLVEEAIRHITTYVEGGDPIPDELWDEFIICDDDAHLDVDPDAIENRRARQPIETFYESRETELPREIADDPDEVEIAIEATWRWREYTGCAATGEDFDAFSTAWEVGGYSTAVAIAERYAELPTRSA